MILYKTHNSAHTPIFTMLKIINHMKQLSKRISNIFQ